MIFSKNFRTDSIWYCLRTKPKKENALASYISHNLGIEVFVPKIRYDVNRGGKLSHKNEVMFPGYIFAKFNILNDKRSISYAPGISHILSFNNSYINVPELIINNLKKSLDKNDEMNVSLNLKIGDEVLVTDGIMRGMKVKINSLSSELSRVGILLDLLGTTTEIEIPSYYIKQNRLGAILA